ncbi:PAS domain S-box protein [Solidesulfovibrio carbinolicus]|uniref:Sensory/regulatory protein RpfC n=1 Tax=Solidesulfovibrio carbinolicus TaxID=296842 RepID=A0A4P6HJY6_9BACT|nr:PAS domain S-box protein [Solidesulfovibrio carbinolicus]QAZ67195.1 hybrid sensor histidine kinase/response regulator [Solidesulfovibrio carbinolicus]
MADTPSIDPVLSLELVRSLYEKAPVMLHSLDVRGRLLSVNAMWRQTLGYSLDAVVGRSFGDFMTPASRADFEATLPRFVREGRLTDKPYQLVASDERVIEVSLSAVGEYDATGTFRRSLAALVDVTGRRQAEEALAKSEELFRLAFENANEGLAMVGLDGRFLRVNAALCRFFGYESEALLGKTINDLAAEGHEAVSPRFISLALAGVREEFRFEKRYRHASGEEVWGQVSAKLVRGSGGEPLYFISHLLDVTEARRTAARLTLHANTLEALLRLGRMRGANLAALGEFVLSRGVALTASKSGLAAMSDPATGRFAVLAAGSEALAVFGLGQGTREFDLRDSPSLAMAVGDLRPVVGDTPCCRLATALRGDGQTFILAVAGRATPYGDDDINRLTLLGEGVLRHVKERRREEDLTTARRQAEAASQAKSGFLANMSHEIRTPLSGIIGLTQMTLTQNPRPEIRENLELILDSSRSLLGIVNDILDFSKIEAGKMEFVPVDFDPRDTLDRTMKSFQFLARQKGLILGVRIDPQVPAMVHGDPDRIMQVVRNLVGNALKFTDQGEVEVTLSLARPGDPMLVSCSVRDTGIGIPEDRLHELFQVFSQLESTRAKRYGGTGLGLAISRRLVEMMGGSIDVESVPGQGSAFTFTVSLRPASAAAPEPERLACAAQAGGFAGLRVLLAEDNQVNRLFLKHFLTEAGCQVRLAGSGLQALELLCQEPADLVLMDIQMPEMDGAEATRRIREGEVGEAARGMPVVALTAYSMKGDRERFLSVGLDDYVSKPVDVDELFMVMRRVLSRPVEPAKAAVSATGVMDLDYYEQRGKSAFAREICRMFLEESPQVVVSLETAMREANWEAAGDAAHTLLGMAVPLRARGLTEGARKLQEAGLSGNSAGCRDACRLVVEELGRVQTAIGELLK